MLCGDSRWSRWSLSLRCPMVHPGGQVREQVATGPGVQKSQGICIQPKLQGGVASSAPNAPGNPALCLQPQPPLPDVLVWMFSGQRRVAYARIPAQDVLFSVVEEERGRDCGKIQSLLLTVRRAWGGGAGESGVHKTGRGIRGGGLWLPTRNSLTVSNCPKSQKEVMALSRSADQQTCSPWASAVPLTNEAETQTG